MSGAFENIPKRTGHEGLDGALAQMAQTRERRKQAGEDFKEEIRNEPPPAPSASEASDQTEEEEKGEKLPWWVQ